MKHALLLLLAIAISISLPAQKLSRTEKKILQQVETNYDQSVDFLERTVNINSGTFNHTGVQEVGKLYDSLLTSMGFETQWIDMPSEMNRGGHLRGEIKGSKGKKILLIGHIDTVFEPDSPFQTWEVTDSIATGPGATDMKGGDMVLLYALKALHEAGQLKDRQIIVMLHGDEENAGDPIDLSRKDIIEAAQQSDVALSFEPGTGYHYATVARRGSSSWHLEVKGKQSHSSRLFTENVGAGAVYETARILHRFYNELQEQYLTYNPGIIVGGTKMSMDTTGTQGSVNGKTNVVANMTIVNGDLRFITEEQKEKTREKMRAIVADHLPLTESSITFEDGYPAMPPTDGNRQLLSILDQVSQDLGQGEVEAYDPGKRGAGDISFIAEYLDCLDGLGAIGGNSHAPEEFINLNSLEDIIKRASVFIHRLSNE
ncbi:MAG: M20/M25/M40 family metallo-hydrolase [Cyclobacteriaceae bacterium]